MNNEILKEYVANLAELKHTKQHLESAEKALIEKDVEIQKLKAEITNLQSDCKLAQFQANIRLSTINSLKVENADIRVWRSNLLNRVNKLLKIAHNYKQTAIDLAYRQQELSDRYLQEVAENTTLQSKLQQIKNLVN
jgi:chromosome segregation ATPase